jgi:hypothetical protein
MNDRLKQLIGIVPELSTKEVPSITADSVNLLKQRLWKRT